MLFCFRNGDREQQCIITPAVVGQAIMLAANTFRVSRHTGGHGGRSRFLTPFPAGNIGNYTHRKPYRKGVVCVTVASLILICGSIMTILGKCLFLGASGVILIFFDEICGSSMTILDKCLLYPPQNEVLGGYTVFSLSVIP